MTEADVQKVLATTIDPIAGRDFVSGKSVRKVAVSGGDVAIELALGYPARSRHDLLRKIVIDAVSAIPGVGRVTVDIGTRIVSHAVQRGVKLIPGVKNIVAVASGKGGVGKSTTAVNLAIALAQEGATVGILDADIYGPSMPRLFGISERPDMAEDGRSLKPFEKYGVKVMSIGFLIEDDAPVVWRGPMVMTALTQLLHDVAWGELDVLVVDMPPGTGDAQLTMAQNAKLSGAVIVSTPQDLALIDARRGVAMFKQVHVPILGVVENMSYFVCPHCNGRTDVFAHGGARREAERLGVPFLGEIPLDIAIRETSDGGRPVVASAPDSAHAAAYLALAEKVRAGLDAPAEGKRRGPRIVMD